MLLCQGDILFNQIHFKNLFFIFLENIIWSLYFYFSSDISDLVKIGVLGAVLVQFVPLQSIWSIEIGSAWVEHFSIWTERIFRIDQSTVGIELTQKISMDNDSGDDSNIVRGQREKSQKRKKRIEAKITRDNPWRNISFLRIFMVFHNQNSYQKKEKIAINKREKLI